MPQETERIYRMLIVDDEPATRHGLRTAVNWSLMHVEIVGEGRDGVEALALAEQLRPDIIICDVRMPRMDGIALANALSARRLNAAVLFISGYSNREYLKSAIQLGAVDFIDKPFQLSELISAVERAKASCVSRPAPANVDEDGLALSLISGERAGAVPYPLQDQTPLFSFIIRLEPPAGENAPVLSTINTRRALQKCKAALQAQLGDRFVVSPVTNGIVGLANVPDGVPSDELPARLAPILRTLDVGVVCIGLGQPVPAISLAHQSYQQAYAASASAFLLGHGRVISSEMISLKPYVPSSKAISDFQSHVQQGSISAAMETLEALIGVMRTCRYQDIPLMKDTLSRLSLWLVTQQKTAPQSGVTELIGAARDLDTVKDLIIDLTEALLDLRNRLTARGRVVFDAERYILSHLDSDLSVHDIAAHVYVTPTHLCYLYKKNTGQTIGQFILRVRMQKAENMICNTAMKVSEIAHATGYANPNYFSRIFQDYFGLTPTEYREKHL